MIGYWNSHTHEEIINFVKTHEILTGEYEEDANIGCETFEEWCDGVRIANDFPKSSLINKYFDFSRMLRDGWRRGVVVGFHRHLVGRKNDELYMIDGHDCDDAELSWCWVVAVVD